MYRVLLILLLQMPLVYGTDWFAYVVDSFNNQAIPINLVTQTPESPLATGEFPISTVITPDGSKAYVLNKGEPSRVPPEPGSVTVIDIASNTVKTTMALTSTLSFPFFPAGIAIAPDGKTVYVSGKDLTHKSYLIPLTTALEACDSPISLPYGFWGAVAITPDGKTAFVLKPERYGPLSGVIPITLADRKVGDTISIGQFLNSIAITPDGRYAYLTTNHPYLYQLDIASQSASAEIVLPSVGNDIAITPDGKTAYITSWNGDEALVLPLDLKTQLPLTPIDTSPYVPREIAIAPDGATAYITIDDGILPISLKTQKFGNPIETIGYGLAITPDQAPLAHFTVQPARKGSDTMFDASASSTPTGTLTSYAWDFGDGRTATYSLPTASHVYKKKGHYTVSLSVTNSAGTSGSQTFTGKTVSNNGGPSATFTQSIQIP